ncbi:MAG: ATP-binding protein [Ignavibacteriales bacterium]|nr:ATP-binding protein [Ignavibacteriales bacterium]
MLLVRIANQLGLTLRPNWKNGSLRSRIRLETKASLSKRLLTACLQRYLPAKIVLKQVLFNLLVNAFINVNQGGQISVTGETGVSADGAAVAYICITRIQEPGSTTTGVLCRRFPAPSQAMKSLFVARRFVELHKGMIDMESGDPDTGNTIKDNAPRCGSDLGTSAFPADEANQRRCYR